MSDTAPLVRQWMLLRMLAARRYGATLREMADEMEVNQKTIRRDLAALHRVGFPLTETAGQNGRKHWTLDGDDAAALRFTVDEAAALYLARQLLEPLAGTYFWESAQRAFRKIRASLGETAIGYLGKLAAAFHQTAVGAGDYAQQADTIDALMVAIEDRRITFIAYQSMNATEPVTYDVYPYGLIYHRGSLYLVAFAPRHDELRHYKVDRIAEADVQPLRFNRPDGFNLREHLAGSFGVYRGGGTPLRVRVRFLPPVARYVAESNWHASQKLTPRPDGSRYWYTVSTFPARGLARKLSGGRVSPGVCGDGSRRTQRRPAARPARPRTASCLAAWLPSPPLVPPPA